MKIARFLRAGAVEYGVVEGDRVFSLLGDIFGEYAKGREKCLLSEVKLLTPCVPPKVLAVGLNYRSHLGQRQAPANPEIFFKPTSCVMGPEENIVVPRGSSGVHYEGELVVVMKRRARHITPEQAADYILGYSCGNDVSERDWQRNDIQWWRAKGADTFGPFGPYIVDDIDPNNVELQTRLNGEVKQSSNTSDLIHNCAKIVSFVSQMVTLEPGDIIFSGTPGTTSAMKPGDVVEVEIGGIGVLRNTVVAES